MFEVFVFHVLFPREGAQVLDDLSGAARSKALWHHEGFMGLTFNS